MAKAQEFKSCRNCGFNHMNTSLVHKDNCPKCGEHWYWGWICPKCNGANHYREYRDDADCNYCDFVNGQERKTSGGCFITTATITSLGEDDNCYELNKFRKFRDEILSEKRSKVEEYYRIAPMICCEIDKLQNSDNEYRMIWDKYLEECLVLIENEKYEDTAVLYEIMVDDLKKKYFS